MKEAIIVDLAGVYKGVEIVPTDADGVTPIYAPVEQQANTEGANETPQEQTNPPEPILTGYQVAVNCPGGFFVPKFNLDKWTEYVALRDAPTEYTAGADGIQVPISRNLPDPSTFWEESLSAEEIAERTKPQPVVLTPEQQQIAQLQDALKAQADAINMLLGL